MKSSVIIRKSGTLQKGSRICNNPSFCFNHAGHQVLGGKIGTFMFLCFNYLYRVEYHKIIDDHSRYHEHEYTVENTEKRGDADLSTS